MSETCMYCDKEIVDKDNCYGVTNGHIEEDTGFVIDLGEPWFVFCQYECLQLHYARKTYIVEVDGVKCECEGLVQANRFADVHRTAPFPPKEVKVYEKQY